MKYPVKANAFTVKLKAMLQELVQAVQGVVLSVGQKQAFINGKNQHPNNLGSLLKRSRFALTVQRRSITEGCHSHLVEHHNKGHCFPTQKSYSLYLVLSSVLAPGTLLTWLHQ